MENNFWRENLNCHLGFTTLANTKCRVMENVNRDHLLQFVKKPARNLTTFFNECGVFLVNKIGLFCSNNTYVLIMNLINNRQGTHNVSKK